MANTELSESAKLQLNLYFLLFIQSEGWLSGSYPPDKPILTNETFILSINLKIIAMKVLTVKEAVEMVNKGKNLEGVVLDESTIKQVNVRDALVLARGGIVIPEQNIYYKDDEIEYDEDIDELFITSGVVNLSWEEKARRAKEFSKKDTVVVLDLSTQKPEIDDWIAKNREKIEKVLKPIVIDLFYAEKTIRE